MERDVPQLTSAPAPNLKQKFHLVYGLPDTAPFAGKNGHCQPYLRGQNRYTKVSIPKSAQTPSAQPLAILGRLKLPNSSPQRYNTFYVEHFVFGKRCKYPLALEAGQQLAASGFHRGRTVTSRFAENLYHPRLNARIILRQISQTLKREGLDDGAPIFEIAF
jgi:hypothetical protein